jgi:hypothetical protein
MQDGCRQANCRTSHSRDRLVGRLSSGFVTNPRRFLPTAKFACDYMLRSIASLHCRALQFLHPSVCEVTQMHRHLVLAEIIQSYEFAISER